MDFFNNVCIYMRLSKDDGDKAESESISNQRKLLKRYAEDIGIKINKEYVDDGYSGTNFNRPKFKEMISDVKLKKIDTIIVKDLSRFARESVEASEYIEKFFPEHDVRFIAVLDNIDTYLDSLANVLIEFKLYNNQKFAKDVSDKLKKSKRSNMEKGLYMGTYAPYGYKKDPNNKGKLVVDKNSSRIVKKIYNMYIDGKSSQYIAKYLNSKKIKTPAEYYHITPNKKTNMYGIWKRTQILRILKNEVYIGNTVRNVVNKVSYREKKKRQTNKDEWIITKNTHEPIIDKCNFEKVHEILNSKRKTTNVKVHNYLFRPYMRCAKCGRKLNFNVRSDKVVTINCPKSDMNCCGKYYYNYFKLEKEIINNIKGHYKKLFDLVSAEDDIILKKNKDYLKNIDEKLKKLNYDYNRVNDNIDSLYMKKLDNLINDEDYLKDTKILKEKRDNIQNEINKYNDLKSNINEENILELKKNIQQENNIINNNIKEELIEKLIYNILISKNEIVINYKFKFILLDFFLARNSHIEMLLLLWPKKSVVVKKILLK